MNLSELKAIFAACGTDAEFLAHPEVRRVYWQVVIGHSIRWMHRIRAERDRVSTCGANCGALWIPEHERWEKKKPGGSWEVVGPECQMPDPIPGSLVDACELMRQAYDKQCNGDREKSLILFSHQTPREWFMAYAAAAGAVEISGQQGEV